MINLENLKMNKPLMMSATEYEASDLGKTGEFLIDELIPEGRIGLLTAPSKSNKTTLAWNIALSIANGTNCIGHKILKQGKVLYILLEGSLRGLIESFGNSDNIDIIPDIDFIFEKYIPFLNEVISQNKYKLIIIDSLYKATACNISNANEVTPFMKEVEKMAKKHNTTFLFLHHNGRNNNPAIEQDMNNVSGSMNLVRAAEFTLMLNPIMKNEEEELMEMKLSKEEFIKLPRKRILRKMDYRDGGEGWDKYNLEFHFSNNRDGYIDAYRYKSNAIRANPKDRLEDLTNCSIDILKEYPTINKKMLSSELSKVYRDLTVETITKKYAGKIIDELVKKNLIIKDKRYDYVVINKEMIN